MPKIVPHNNKYRYKYTKELLQGLRKDGMSKIEVCQRWGITKKTYDCWRDKYPQFEEAHQHGERDCASWWHALTRKAASGEVKANAGIICFALTNIEHINWSSKVDVHNSHDEQIHSITIEVIDGRTNQKQLTETIIDVNPVNVKDNIHYLSKIENDDAFDED